MTCINLNFPVQEMECQELEGDHPVVRQVEQVNGVDDLLRWHNQIYHLQIKIHRTFKCTEFSSA